MSVLLYQSDSYLKTFEATVVAVDPGAQAVALDRTAFYPGGGGQPPDQGWLRVGEQALPVRTVRRQGEQVWHVLQGPLPAVGTPVRGELDWARRYQLMRTHTALHILCGVVWRDYGALVTGGNMEPLKGRMDFEFETLRQELVREIEAKVNAEIEQGREVRVRLLPREEALQIPDLIRTKVNLLPPDITTVRVVEIVGLDVQADGGTHVANTREVGPVCIVNYQSKGRLNKRLHLALAP
ncbi:MAG: alanyl-tRNA editing protein AlaX [Candidatus Tectimicrobiota bacterium]|nr:MAG: alanyl-tRNA editing protein AlaX [Candidatus Tectomicrobia bacterium]